MLCIVVCILVGVYYPRKPVIHITDVSISQLSTATILSLFIDPPAWLNISFGVNATVYNPNFVDAAFDPVDVHLLVNDAPSGFEVIPGGKIGKRSTLKIEAYMHLNVTLPPSDQLAAWATEITVAGRSWVIMEQQQTKTKTKTVFSVCWFDYALLVLQNRRARQ